MKNLIKVLKAGTGDSILIHLEGQNILIDGGGTMAYPSNLRKELQNIAAKGEKVELLIATHFDNDHINGLKKVFEEIRDDKYPKSFIKELWFQIPPNITIPISSSSTTRIGAEQAKRLEKILLSLNQKWSKDDNITNSNPPLRIGKKTKFYILSPTIETLVNFKNKYEKEWESSNAANPSNDYGFNLSDFNNDWLQEDDSFSNGSSIALLIEHDKKNIGLFLGDAFPSVIVSSLKSLGFSRKNRLEVSYVKLSHHGSQKSLSKELLEITDCKNFIISTSATKDNLPNKKTFAHILRHYKDLDPSNYNINFLFNYEEDNYKGLFSSKDFEDFNFRCLYRNYSSGHLIQL